MTERDNEPQPRTSRARALSAVPTGRTRPILEAARRALLPMDEPIATGLTALDDDRALFDVLTQMVDQFHICYRASRGPSAETPLRLRDETHLFSLINSGLMSEDPVSGERPYLAVMNLDMPGLWAQIQGGPEGFGKRLEISVAHSGWVERILTSSGENPSDAEAADVIWKHVRGGVVPAGFQREPCDS